MKSRLSVWGRTAGMAALVPSGLAWGQLTSPITAGSAGLALEQITTFSGGPPLDLTHAGDGSGRIFIAGQNNGQVKLYKNGALVATPFLDIPGRGITLATGGERGLLGVAFHTNYNAAAGTAGRGKLYTYTSEPKGPAVDFSHPELGASGGDHDSVIREWTVNPANPDVVDATVASRVVLRLRQPQSNHNGGALRFGQDGYMYIALGDGGGSNDNSGGITSPTDGHTNDTGNAQDIANVYGKMLRIDPRAPGSTGGSADPVSANAQYRVPQSNPFAGATAGVDEIFAYGLRNPFRFSFDRGTGTLYTGDVGQGQREEVDTITSGGNYGWVYMEGTRVNRAPPGGFSSIAPVGEYTHGDGNAVIGGFVYRGSNMPELEGKYVFGDLAGTTGTTGRLFYMNAGGGTITEVVYLSGAVPGQLYAFGEDQDGELYATFSNGNVSRLLGRQWGANGGGSWNDGSRWLGGVPGGVGARANFLGRLTTAANAPAIVTLDGNKTVGALRFNNVTQGGGGPFSYVIASGSGGTLTLDNGAAAAEVKVVRGAHRIEAPVHSAGNATVDVPAGATLVMSGSVTVAAGRTVTKTGAGESQFIQALVLGGGAAVSATAGTLSARSITGGALGVQDGATVKIEPNGTSAGVSRLTNLDIVAGGRLDLNDNDLVVSYSGSSPFSTIRGYVLSGYSPTPDPTKTGIVSTSGQNPNAPGGAILALFDNAETGLTEWPVGSGVSVSSQSVIGKYTYFGDVNLDGQVSAADYAVVDSSIGAMGLDLRTSWIRGDANGDGAVSAADYGVLDSNVGQGIGNPLGPAALSAVPESAMLWALGCGAWIGMRRRGRTDGA